ncbi:MAG TPA: hypothetical protein VEK07_07610 [Polyangiaceae bacterium]|nr:hypothetical protein [Polyangiaceae bacterium]
MRDGPTGRARAEGALRGPRAALVSALGFAALTASLGGCGLILGLSDHDLFPEGDGAVGTSVEFDGAAGSPDVAQGVPDGSTAGPDGSGDLLDGSSSADVGFGGFPDVSPPCPWTACEPGTTCCYSGGADLCEGSCEIGSYFMACTGAYQCEAGACCANLQAVSSGGHGPTGPAPRCNGWAFQGSTCGSCATSIPMQCTAAFTLRMCASAAECPTAQPYCCHVAEDNPFTYCVDSTLSAAPSTCLP